MWEFKDYWLGKICGPNFESKANELNICKAEARYLLSEVGVAKAEIDAIKKHLADLESGEEPPQEIKNFFATCQDASGYVHKYRRYFKCEGMAYRSAFDARQLFSIGSARIGELCKQIYQEYKPTNVPEMLAACFTWQALRVTYKYDSEKFGFGDFWEYPEEVFLQSENGEAPYYRSDCESKAFAECSLAHNFYQVGMQFAIPWWLCNVDLGFIGSTGHGWTRFYDQASGKWRIHEATSPTYVKDITKLQEANYKTSAYKGFYGVWPRKLYIYENIVFDAHMNVNYGGGEMKTRKEKLNSEVADMLAFAKRGKNAKD